MPQPQTNHHPYAAYICTMLICIMFCLPTPGCGTNPPQETSNEGNKEAPHQHDKAHTTETIKDASTEPPRDTSTEPVPTEPPPIENASEELPDQAPPEPVTEITHIDVQVKEVPTETAHSEHIAPEKSTVCGDGKREGHEQCDDNNNTSKDGCSKTCQIEVSTHFTAPHQRTIFDLIIQTIKLAKKGSNIHASYYLLKDQDIIDALIVAKKKGVHINIVVDDTATNNNLRTSAKDICLNGQTNCVHTCTNSCLGKRNDYNTINHNKFFLFSELTDGRKHVVFQSSSNLYAGSLTRFQDLIVVPYDKPLYDAYVNHFNKMKAEDAAQYVFTKVTGRSGAKAHFFPKPSGTDEIIDILKDVVCDQYTKIRVGMAYFYDNTRIAVAEQLHTLSTQGCDIKVIISTSEDKTAPGYKSPGYNVFSKLGKMLVKIESQLHSKFVTIDAKLKSATARKRFVIAGSHNWTYSALRQNDETFILMEDDTIYKAYLAYWQRIFAYTSMTSRDERRKYDIHLIANALEQHYAKHMSYTQPEDVDSDCSTGDAGKICGTGTQWATNSDLRDVVKDGFLSHLPVDPINNTRHHYTYEPWNGGASQGGQHRGWKYSLCANELELTGKPYCVRAELGKAAVVQ